MHQFRAICETQASRSTGRGLSLTGRTAEELAFLLLDRFNDGQKRFFEDVVQPIPRDGGAFEVAVSPDPLRRLPSLFLRYDPQFPLLVILDRLCVVA